MTVKSYRKKMGYTQQALANRFDVALNTVIGWENKGTPRTIENMLAEVYRLEQANHESQNEIADLKKQLQEVLDIIELKKFN